MGNMCLKIKDIEKIDIKENGLITIYLGDIDKLGEDIKLIIDFPTLALDKQEMYLELLSLYYDIKSKNTDEYRQLQ